MSAPLCFDFLRNADWVWECIATAQASGFPFGEETITETILLDLKANHPSKLFILPFTKSQERLNGADWEWWIGRDGNWIGMRVQAKRISLPSERFNSLFYRSKTGAKRQIEHLLEKAGKAGLIPIFALYTHSVNEPSLQSRAQHCLPNLRWPFHECGCLVAHAQDVEDIGSLKLSEIAPVAFPWHLLACHCVGVSSGPDRPADSIAGLLARSGDALFIERDRETERFVGEPQERLPDYVEALRFDDETGKHEGFLRSHMRKWDLGGMALFDVGMAGDE